MATNDNKHLKLRGNVWWYQRRTPKDLLEQYSGKTSISESLGTGDIREARRKRDIINGKLEEKRLNNPNPARHRFHQLIKSMSEDKTNFPETWDEHYDLDRLSKDKDDVFIHAYTTITGRKDHNYRYRVTLKEALKNWTNQYKQLKTKGTLLKVAGATKSFLKHINRFDIQLEEITKSQVNEFIADLQTRYAKTTVTGVISRLRTLWSYCDALGEIQSKNSPFDNNIYAPSEAVNKKQPFTPNEMEQIKSKIEASNTNEQLLVELGVFTGCRISELCNLRAKDIVYNEEHEIVAIHIEKGKTEAATRTIPLTNELGARVRSIAESKNDDELLLGFENSADMSRWFSNIKTKHVSTDTAKCFHSFRVMFATALQQAGVDELRAAALLGHKRGNTMSYGYYSRGYSLQQLKEAYDLAITKIAW